VCFLFSFNLKVLPMHCLPVKREQNRFLLDLRLHMNRASPQVMNVRQHLLQVLHIKFHIFNYEPSIAPHSSYNLRLSPAFLLLRISGKKSSLCLIKMLKIFLNFFNGHVLCTNFIDDTFSFTYKCYPVSILTSVYLPVKSV
jgi:hypothetical protein